MNVLGLQLIVGIGGATFFALGLRFLLMGGSAAGKKAVVSNAMDSHIRYFGVAGLGCSLLMWQNIPRITAPLPSFYIMISVIFVGGIVRLLTLMRRKVFDREVILAAIPELVLPPLVYFWQAAIAMR